MKRQVIDVVERRPPHRPDGGTQATHCSGDRISDRPLFAGRLIVEVDRGRAELLDEPGDDHLRVADPHHEAGSAPSEAGMQRGERLANEPGAPGPHPSQPQRALRPLPRVDAVHRHHPPLCMARGEPQRLVVIHAQIAAQPHENRLTVHEHASLRPGAAAAACVLA